MRILVANLGSTSFKFKLLDMEQHGEVVARGTYERIGQPGGQYASHAEVIDAIIKVLDRPPDAIGFKAVHGGPICGAVRVTDEVLEIQQQYADIAPAHNPAYIQAMKAFAVRLPKVPQVAAFETAFHQTVPLSRQIYAIPWEWTQDLGIRRYGFHGASHRYIAERSAELIDRKPLRVISCHLGGSCSVCAIENGRSIAQSFGLTPQTGVFHNNRVGEFDIFAMQRLTGHGVNLDQAMKKLGKESGLLGISGVSNDMRDVEREAANGNERATLAMESFIENVRQYVGSYLVALGGVDALVFTGGIGENGAAIRQGVCRNLEWAGLVLDKNKNQAKGREEKISAVESNAEIWIIPTNEEWIVAKQTQAVLTAN
ncbi:MAG: acetate/propionate family kinase [Phycisphaerales bacterium]|nr:acetate/propionate family kinase [Phycisphaerales bacterium]